ncbi:MAG: transposase [Parcubacteria group bacterium Greene0416_79]|nr:MAG: transposase [Parcubacteria group bacterium Greene0416_79]
MKEYKHLSASDRLSIYHGVQEGDSIRSIAKTLGRDPGTISREVARNKTPLVYLPDTACRQYKERRKHCRPKSRLSDSELRTYILLKLEKGWSPELIAGRLRKRFGRTLVHHETIYKFIYDSEMGIQWKLYEYLPRGKRKRTKRRGRKTKKCAVKNRVFIEMRQREANERSEVGHWETDSVLFGYRQSVNTAADRMSRFTVLTKLPSRDAEATTTALTERVSPLPVKSITADSGPENAEHEKISLTFGAPFFFCHPYHSWEKGTIENRNGVVRRYRPKETNLDEISQSDLDDIAFEINNRPMKCLNFSTPYEVLLANSVALRN